MMTNIEYCPREDFGYSCKYTTVCQATHYYERNALGLFIDERKKSIARIKTKLEKLGYAKRTA